MHKCFCEDNKCAFAFARGVCFFSSALCCLRAADALSLPLGPACGVFSASDELESESDEDDESQPALYFVLQLALCL